MRAVQLTELAGPESVRVVEIDEPDAAGGQVVIEVHAAGVAFPDVLMSKGLYQYKPELPFVFGGEVSGIVRSAPEGARVKAGDRVAALTGLGGGMAEVAVAAPDLVFPLPDAVSLPAGAGLLFNDLTMDFAYNVRGRLRAGDTVLVHGAAGGVGTSALRLARAFDAARVIAVVSTEEKADVARAAGATDVVLVDGWLDQVRALTEGKGVDIVVDPVGGDRFTDSLRSLARGGRVLVIGFTAGGIPEVKVNRLLLNNIEVVGVGWGAWWMGDPSMLPSQWERIQPLLASGKLAAPEPDTRPFEDAAAAIASLEDRSARGKVVLTVR
ncbi:NADPH:quinone oxidoreductase family protein [Aldersonia kunmingensis]|uniref:NADPH:quinone oxidoreductase family protein n=1 Tax=Aldersonia kunmingensis TaxID=408066 RepID=UPI00082F2E75|nr:NADPH:quinone oxidoreductase family protein [Aldersonia kunmingensis]